MKKPASIIRAVTCVAAILAFVPAPAPAAVVIKTDTTSEFADASSLTRQFVITGLESGFETVSKVTLEIFFAKSDNNSFVGQSDPMGSGGPYFNEISITLTAPDATVVSLIPVGSFDSGSASFRGTITFDQSAADVVNVNVSSPSSGTFRPVAPGDLTVFNGKTAAGTWTLTVGDSVGADGLSYYSSTLTVSTVPEPGSVALIGLGLGAVLLRRQRPSR